MITEEIKLRIAEVQIGRRFQERIKRDIVL